MNDANRPEVSASFPEFRNLSCFFARCLGNDRVSRSGLENRRDRTYPSNNRRRTTWARTGTSAPPSRTSRVPNSPADTAARLCPFRRSSRLSSLSCRCTSRRRTFRDRCSSGSDNPLRRRRGISDKHIRSYYFQNVW